MVDDAAVGQQFAGAVEDDVTVAQQAPALFGVEGHDMGRRPVAGGRRTSMTVRARALGCSMGCRCPRLWRGTAVQ
ncbi:hypothetical protein [Sphaerisporangium sp. NPDC051011]|uniref:hypothetical protein n=1 Tax=Sphaerisporangium sp. NPDC051011 TaxID=3155792 RepID=UPI0033EB6BA5